MNHSIYSADRSTHLKVVVVALAAGIAVAGLSIFARTTSNDYAQTAPIKASTVMTVTNSSATVVR